MAISTDSLVSLMKDELGSVFVTEAHNDASLISNICSGIRYIANKRDFPFLIKRFSVSVLAPDTEVTTIEKVKTLSVFLGDVPKIPVDIVEYYVPGLTSKYVGSWGTSFVAKEIGTYNICASVLPTFPTSTADIIDFPDYMTDALFNISMMFAKKKEKMYADAAEYKNIADAIIAPASDRSSNVYPSEQKVMGRNHNIL